MSVFDQVFEIILRQEGGFQNSPADKGNWVNGRLVGTKYGISARSYPNLDIRNLTVEQAKAIYKRDYWDEIGGDNIKDAGLGLVHMDTAINAGPARAKQFLESSGGNIDTYLNQRLSWYKTLDDWGKWGKGWTKRVNDIRQEAHRMSKGGGSFLDTIKAAGGGLFTATLGNSPLLNPAVKQTAENTKTIQEVKDNLDINERLQNAALSPFGVNVIGGLIAAGLITLGVILLGFSFIDGGDSE